MTVSHPDQGRLGTYNVFWSVRFGTADTGQALARLRKLGLARPRYYFQDPIQQIAIQLNRIPLFLKLNRGLYRLALRVGVCALISIDGVKAIYLRGSMADNHFIPG